MKGFTPGFFDRLLGTPVRHATSSTLVRMSVEDLKDVVARDLEALLNTRSMVSEALLKAYPECGNSIVSYGMIDFADLSLSSPSDRAQICASIEKAIACHEPRLRGVKAVLDVREGTINRLNFSITGLLVASASEEPVNFDAVLQPSTLQYSINKTGRASASAAAATAAGGGT